MGDETEWIYTRNSPEHCMMCFRKAENFIDLIQRTDLSNLTSRGT